jgi:hypothetical protein
MILLEGPVSWWSVSEVFCRLQATVPTPQAHKGLFTVEGVVAGWMVAGASVPG